jgi:hypothetical protein
MNSRLYVFKVEQVLYLYRNAFLVLPFPNNLRQLHIFNLFDNGLPRLCRHNIGCRCVSVENSNWLTFRRGNYSRGVLFKVRNTDAYIGKNFMYHDHKIGLLTGHVNFCFESKFRDADGVRAIYSGHLQQGAGI